MSRPKKRDKTTSTSKPRLDLKEACVLAARQVIAEEGLENLSLREVARKLGVSHQAPYRHYENRDALLIEVLRRSFMEFGHHLSNRPPAASPAHDLQLLGDQFMSFNSERPLEYRLLYSTVWPSTYAQHEDLLQAAQYPFEVLKKVLRKVYQARPDKLPQVEADALYMWMSAHGIASLSQSDALAAIKLETPLVPDLLEHARLMLSRSVGLTLQAPSLI